MNEVDKTILEQIPTPKHPMAPFLWFGEKGRLARGYMEGVR